MKDKCMHEYGERKPVAILSDNIASRCCPAGKSVYVVTTITCLWYNFGMLLIRYFLRPFLTGRSVSFLLSFSSIQGGCQQLPCCQTCKNISFKPYSTWAFCSRLSGQRCLVHRNISLIPLAGISPRGSSSYVAVPQGFSQTLHSTKSPWVLLIHSMASTPRFCSRLEFSSFQTCVSSCFHSNFHIPS